MSFTQAFLDEMDNVQEIVYDDTNFNHLVGAGSDDEDKGFGDIVNQKAADLNASFSNQAINRQINYVSEANLDIDFS